MLKPLPAVAGYRTPVLDANGYVMFVEAWGTGVAGAALTVNDYEIGIIEAARQSTHSSFTGWERDAKLLSSLYTRHHDSPFEFAGLVLEIAAPIMVFREWQRHRTQSYNEASARYAALPAKDYIPTVDRVMMGAAATTNTQAMGSGALLTADNAKTGLNLLAEHYYQTERLYKQLQELGFQRELARLPLSVGRYSKMRVHANLRNWLAFMTLRCDPNAQWEIRQYADVVGGYIAGAFPQTAALWDARFTQEQQL